MGKIGSEGTDKILGFFKVIILTQKMQQYLTKKKQTQDKKLREENLDEVVLEKYLHSKGKWN